MMHAVARCYMHERNDVCTNGCYTTHAGFGLSGFKSYCFFSSSRLSHLVTNNYQLAEFASIAVTGYYISSALYRESLLELMPMLFEMSTFKLQWSTTVLFWVREKHKS